MPDQEELRKAEELLQCAVGFQGITQEQVDKVITMLGGPSDPVPEPSYLGMPLTPMLMLSLIPEVIHEWIDDCEAPDQKQFFRQMAELRGNLQLHLIRTQVGNA